MPDRSFATRAICTVITTTLGVFLLSATAWSEDTRTPAPAQPPAKAQQPAPQTGKPVSANADANDMRSQDSSFLSQLKQIGNDPTKANDRMFVLGASMYNTKDVETARLVSAKTSNPEVKRLAQGIVTGHQEANEKLAEVARELDVTLITEVSAMDRAHNEVLLSLPPEQLDQVFVSNLRAGHMAGICALQDQAVISENAALKAYATGAVAAMKKHGELIAAASKSVGLPATMMEPSMRSVSDSR